MDFSPLLVANTWRLSSGFQLCHHRIPECVGAYPSFDAVAGREGILVPYRDSVFVQCLLIVLVQLSFTLMTVWRSHFMLSSVYS